MLGPAYALGVSLLASTVQAAVNVHLYPPPSKLAQDDVLDESAASAALSRHLGLEMFEAAPEFGVQEESFIGVEPLSHSAIVVIAKEEDAKDILPKQLQKPSFTLDVPHTTDSLDSILSTFQHRASHAYSQIHSSQTSDVAFDDLDNTFTTWNLEWISSQPAEVRALMLDNARATLDKTLSLNPDVKLAFLTHSSSAPGNKAKRADAAQPSQSQTPFPPPSPPPQSPIGSISTCYDSADTCTNATSACSGRGQCLKATKGGRSCFVCSCGITQSGNGSSVKTTYWAGAMCERKDVSGQFVLLTGTTIALLLVAAGSVALLSSVGSHELPSVLMGSAVNAKKE